MSSRYASIAALVIAIVLLGHSVTAFQKMRWVTGLLEVIAALVLFWNWWSGRTRKAPALPLDGALR